MRENYWKILVVQFVWERGFTFFIVQVFIAVKQNTPKLSGLKQIFVIFCDSGVDWSDLLIHGLDWGHSHGYINRIVLLECLSFPQHVLSLSTWSLIHKGFSMLPLSSRIAGLLNRMLASMKEYFDSITPNVKKPIWHYLNNHGCSYPVKSMWVPGGMTGRYIVQL